MKEALLSQFHLIHGFEWFGPESIPIALARLWADGLISRDRALRELELSYRIPA